MNPDGGIGFGRTLILLVREFRAGVKENRLLIAFLLAVGLVAFGVVDADTFRNITEAVRDMFGGENGAG